jgi:hypothetical protein
MLFSFFIALFASTAVFADVTGRVNKKVKACTRELESIVYNPANCGFNYLERITNTLRIQAPTFWQNPVQAQAAFETFQNTYGVSAVAISPFGVSYGFIGSSTPIASDNMEHSIARANLDGNGFSNSGDNYIYTTIFWGPDGQMWYVQVTMAKANAPLAC